MSGRAAGVVDPGSLRVGVVIITMGDRPEALGRLLGSVAAQQGPPAEVVVVGNGRPVGDVPDGVRTIDLPENLGIPGGRNVGLQALVRAGVDLILVLDDDGALGETDTVARCREAFAADPRLGIISFRIVDPEDGSTQRRHVPRLDTRDPRQPSRVTTFLGGACAIRSEVITRVGDLPAEFFYAHEETDLAWRALDDGWHIDYRPDMVLHHPRTAPSRHTAYHHNVARNRVWLARRNLPVPLVVVYPAVWAVLTLARRPSPSALRAWWGGFVEGWRAPCGPRRPMSWRTVWTMTRLGRPPVI